MPNEERKVKYFKLAKLLNEASQLMKELEESSVISEGDNEIYMEYPISVSIDSNYAYKFCEGKESNVRVLIHTPKGGINTLATYTGKRINSTEMPYVKYENIDGVAMYSIEKEL